MSEYQYYTIAPGSPADEHVKAMIESRNHRTKVAMKFARKWIGKKVLPYGTEKCIWGFSPASGSVGELIQSLPGGDANWCRGPRNMYYIKPRKVRKPTEQQAALRAEFDAIPMAIDLPAVCEKLCGISQWLSDGLRLCTALLSVSKHHRIFGIPWLAAQGKMSTFGRGTPMPTLCKGLKKMSTDKALKALNP
jgi:hypothetical protein